MRLRRLHPPTSLGMNMTPMIDIVFLLIIFFMTVSQITQSLDHPIDLPDVGPGGEVLDSVSITINVDIAGKMIVAGKEYEMDALMMATRRELARVGNQPAQVRVLIRCDRNCPGRTVNELGQQLAKLGIGRVRLSVQGDE